MARAGDGATAQQAERQREVRVEVGGGGDRQQLGVLLVQAEHVREPGQRVVVRGVGLRVLVAQDREDVVQPSPEVVVETLPTVPRDAHLLHQRGQTLAHALPPVDAPTRRRAPSAVVLSTVTYRAPVVLDPSG